MGELLRCERFDTTCKNVLPALRGDLNLDFMIHLRMVGMRQSCVIIGSLQEHTRLSLDILPQERGYVDLTDSPLEAGRSGSPLSPRVSTGHSGLP